MICSFPRKIKQKPNPRGHSKKMLSDKLPPDWRCLICLQHSMKVITITCDLQQGPSCWAEGQCEPGNHTLCCSKWRCLAAAIWGWFEACPLLTGLQLHVWGTGIS